MVDFETSYSTQTLRKKLDLMNAREYALLNNEQAVNDGLDPYFTDEEFDALGQSYDWQDLVFQSAHIRRTSLNVRGGNQTTQFALSESIFGHEGNVKGSDHKRYSIRALVNHNFTDPSQDRLSHNTPKF